MDPFCVLGSPDFKGIYDFSYTPTSIKGMAETPLFMNMECFGIDMRNYDTDSLRSSGKINIKWVLDLYKAHPKKENFFNSRLSNQTMPIERLIGVSAFRNQVINGDSEEAIRKSWEPGLTQFKALRKKYLIYKDWVDR